MSSKLSRWTGPTIRFPLGETVDVDFVEACCYVMLLSSPRSLHNDEGYNRLREQNN
jgi:hypothetical protein